MSNASTPIPDLWPETLRPQSSQVTPRSILQSQARYLATRTSGIVEGEVVVRTVGPRLFYDFYFIAPRLDHYRFLAFTVVQLQHALYPVAILNDIIPLPETPLRQEQYLADKIFGEECPSEEAFQQRLSQLFQHEQTLHIIDSLIAQSADE